jgi:hypothetical protein
MRAFFVPVRFSGLGDSKPDTARDAGFGFWGVFFRQVKELFCGLGGAFFCFWLRVSGLF